ncbi:hypothetical protein MAGR_64430 [Mycolicibacterium agri]|uniref:Uncharacterized protein n=1 Tax=Mycolicibacterium agri TaxID=36811 RepID=A0A7I9WB99_MYCAG|nr:hypothetical protein MAGR_64430 [Mycolicibacterium agri]
MPESHATPNANIASDKKPPTVKLRAAAGDRSSRIGAMHMVDIDHTLSLSGIAATPRARVRNMLCHNLCIVHSMI